MPMCRCVICQRVSGVIIAFKLFKSKSDGQQFVAFHEAYRGRSQETSLYKSLKAGCKKRITVQYSRMDEHWEVVPVAWRHGKGKKVSDKSNHRRTLIWLTRRGNRNGTDRAPRRAIVQNLNGVRGSQIFLDRKGGCGDELGKKRGNPEDDGG